MKRNTQLRHISQRSGTRQGFTLIELLVVIAIIAVLSAIGLGVLGKARETAKKTQAKNHVTGLVTAVKTYYEDYSQIPEVNAESDEMDIRTDHILMNVLTGIDIDQNPKKTPYFEANPAKGTSGSYKNGLVRDNTRAELYDPWGEMYLMRFDLDFDGNISNDPLKANSSGQNPIYNVQFIAYSYGKDKRKLGQDDIKSWDK